METFPSSPASIQEIAFGNHGGGINEHNVGHYSKHCMVDHDSQMENLTNIVV